MDTIHGVHRHEPRLHHIVDNVNCSSCRLEEASEHRIVQCHCGVLGTEGGADSRVRWNGKTLMQGIAA